MLQNNSPFNKKQLTMAVAAAILGGSLVGCSSDGGGGLPIVAPVAGNSTLSTAGGTGGNDAGWGGDANYVNLYNYGGTAGVAITNSGKAKAGFNSLIGNSRYSKPDMGDVPYTVSADTDLVTYTTTPYYADAAPLLIIAVGTQYVGADHVLREVAVANTIDYAGDVEVTDNSYYISNAPGTLNDLLMADGLASSAPVGSAYLRNTHNEIQVSDGDTAIVDARATGLTVDKGVTLTLPPNSWSTTRTNIDVANSIVNKGTIATTDATATSRTDLNLDAANYYGAAGSSIDTSGHDDVRNGGYVDMNFWTSFVSSSDINTSGATDAAGVAGNADYVYIYGGYVTENNGDIMAMGASGDATNNGADGGYVELDTYVGTTSNTGNINASGGDGASGGNSSYIYIYSTSGYAGQMKNSGDLTANGGNALAAAGGTGGAGDWIGLYNYGSDIISSGELSVAGGDASAADGDGGNVWSGIDIYADAGSASWAWGNADRPAGDIILSGNIDVSGGDAQATGTGSGGNGGYFDAWNDNSYNGQELTGDSVIALKGYSSIVASGGDANYPGDGDWLDLEAYYGWDERSYAYTAGPIRNEADLDTSGGNAPSTSTGNHGGGSYGQGGDVWIATADTYSYGSEDLTTTNLGNIDTSAGDVFNRDFEQFPWTADGGDVEIWGSDGIVNRGDINTSGSTDIAADGGTAGIGGSGAYIEMYAEGPIASAGDLTGNGGDGEYLGGNARGTWIFGSVLKVSGVISANGGNADSALAASVGGDGDDHYVNPSEAGSKITATFSYAAGTGETDGTEGLAIVAGACEGNC